MKTKGFVLAAILAMAAAPAVVFAQPDHAAPTDQSPPTQSPPAQSPAASPEEQQPAPSQQQQQQQSPSPETQQPSQSSQTQQRSRHSGVTSGQARAPSVPLPSGAKLVGSVSVSEIRAFPEEVQTKGGESTQSAVEQVQGTDRVYDVPGAYSDAVAFYDHGLASSGFHVKRRTSVQSATVWTSTRPDGTLARIAVRNTNPVTIEAVTASGD